MGIVSALFVAHARPGNGNGNGNAYGHENGRGGGGDRKKASEGYQEPKKGMSAQFVVWGEDSTFGYSEYAWDHKQGLFRWDFFEDSNITTMIVKAETEEVYSWAYDYDMNFLECASYDFEAEGVPERLTVEKDDIVGEAHVPEHVVGYQASEDVTVWIDEKGKLSETVEGSTVAHIKKFKTKKPKSKWFELPTECTPENMHRGGRGNGSGHNNRGRVIAQCRSGGDRCR